MKIALVHDYLTQLGGAEKVLQNFQWVFKDSPVFVLIYDRKKIGQVFDRRVINTSWLQKMPLSKKRYQWYLMAMPMAAESHKLGDVDVILSSASSFAKGVRGSNKSLHICYCHTATRYLWHDAESYVRELGYNKLIKKIIPLFLKHLRHWDLMAVQGVNKFITNSKVVQARIKKYYKRDSKVIYPPVETDKFYISRELGNYYLIGGRLVAYKRYDLAIQVFNKLGIRLKIFGDGLEMKRLKKMAGKNIEFLGEVSDEKKAKLYSRCIAFIHPQVEDFGITAVEAMASGRPVIAYFDGGARETIVPHQTGEFFIEQNWECLADAIIHFDVNKYNSYSIKEHAEKFNQDRFRKEIRDYIEREWKEFEMNRVFKME
ncbi:MAG: glycosyltransferase [Patescibacteria group bacterium]